MRRRTFLTAVLGTGAATIAGTALSGSRFTAALGLDEGRFQYGVASGDPLPDGIVIWTRVTPDSSATPGSGLGAPTAVDWVVTSDAELSQVVRSGRVTSSAERDHTIKVDVDGLAPGHEYFYGFRAGPSASPTGRFRTAPAPDTSLGRLRFGHVSCSNYAAGYFAAYRHLAERDDLDFVLHVGDYIYEYGDGGYGELRPLDPPTETVVLEDYRRRFAVYRSDGDLRAVHARHAFVTTLDDHEITNDAWANGAENHDPSEGDYLERRDAALRAYDEWMPIRFPTAGQRFHRRLTFGSLADLTMLDLRQYRSEQVTDYADVSDPGRTMLGAEQQQWLIDEVGGSTATWRLIGNSVQAMQVRYPAGFLPDGEGTFRNVDAWDGYAPEREQILGLVGANPQIGSVVFLTGDIHSSWAADLRVDFDDPSTPAVATEFVCTSITSDNLNEILGAPPRSPASIGFENAILAANPHVKLLEFDSHGFCVVDVTAERLQTDWWFISDREDPAATCAWAFSKQTFAGERRIADTDPDGPVVDDVTPDPEIPEVPLNVLLPVTAVAAGAGAIAWTARRQGASDEGPPTPAARA